MGITSHDMLLAFGLMLFFEGLIYALLPNETLRSLFSFLSKMPANELKFSALIVATIGMFIIWYAANI